MGVWTVVRWPPAVGASVDSSVRGAATIGCRVSRVSFLATTLHTVHTSRQLTHSYPKSLTRERVPGALCVVAFGVSGLAHIFSPVDALARASASTTIRLTNLMSMLATARTQSTLPGLCPRGFEAKSPVLLAARGPLLEAPTLSKQTSPRETLPWHEVGKRVD
ncbi:hypothetical protein P154DRAFT_615099 [Amniculicola lignicola CBS 123094]|uniref:Uncharacterized protein n=1 Tax=Amniculicola lignicola CBS 123094 TaxID=1392246 RepID=A0A6A5WZ25_9PLEO|nr:hypothetical protein P154DRAFT_615099 [Amniculicola lignicola CBS 123094]